jgi:uncharacterized protein
MKIGLISDTHGYLDPRVAEIFRGVDHILHGGDIGLPALILELEQIAPVTAVLGNTDSDLHLKETEVVVLEERKFLVHHIVDLPSIEETLRRRIFQEDIDVVVFGHTHRRYSGTIGKTLYLNPGYAGNKRFNLERSVALLHCDSKGIAPEFFDL